MFTKATITQLIDQHGQRLSAIAALAMSLFFASFLILLFQAINIPSAQAQSSEDSQSCGGKNLITEYATTAPEKLEMIKEEAKKASNGHSIFWKVSKPGLPDSWLLGTMHMADPRIAVLEGAKKAAFDQADTVIVESVEALDQAQASAALLQHKEMTLYTDGTTLEDHLSEELLENLRAETDARGLPFAMIKIMRPWLVATSIALPTCEIAAKRSGNPVLDALIAETAKQQNKQLVGLETIGEQFSAMANLPDSFHITTLSETLALGKVAEDVMETMKQLYINGDISMIQPLTRVVAPKSTNSDKFEAFQKSLITDRNLVMAERALPRIEKGSVFVAVGALHLPGETGLVQQFQNAGFNVTPVIGE